MEDMEKFELVDDELDAVVGGYEIGQKISCESFEIKYCPRCGKLLTRYNATITGVRGELDGRTIYWITRDCCGYKSCVSEIAIIG